MVTIAYLGIYSLKNGHSLRKALKGQSSVLFLKTKKEVRMAGFYPANKTPEAALATIHRIYAIRIHNYLGIKDITLSFSSDKRYSWMPGSDTRRGHWDISDTPNKTYNIFEEDGIADLTCILGKNGVGKSRIIKMMLNYIA